MSNHLPNGCDPSFSGTQVSGSGFEVSFTERYKKWRRNRKAFRTILEGRRRRAREAKVRKSERGEKQKTPARKRGKPQPWHLVFIFFGLLILLSLGVAAAFFRPPPTPPKVDPVPVDPAPPVAMNLSMTARDALKKPTPDTLEVKRIQSEAEEAFRAKDFARAEEQLREILPFIRLRALGGFQIYVCLVLQGKSAEADVMAAKFPESAVSRNPAPLYIRAVKAIRNGNPENARTEIESARKAFPEISPLYDQVLRDAGIMPEDIP